MSFLYIWPTAGVTELGVETAQCLGTRSSSEDFAAEGQRQDKAPHYLNTPHRSHYVGLFIMKKIMRWCYIKWTKYVKSEWNDLSCLSSHG